MTKKRVITDKGKNKGFVSIGLFTYVLFTGKCYLNVLFSPIFTAWYWIWYMAMLLDYFWSWKVKSIQTWYDAKGNTDEGFDILKKIGTTYLFSFKCLSCLFIWWDRCFTQDKNYLTTTFQPRQRSTLKIFFFLN